MISIRPWAIFALLLAAMGSARAELGGTAMSIADDQAHMQATRRLEQAPLFTRHVITTPAGVQVTEYAAPSGTVFAVTWRGPFKPDLQQLLGPHFEAYAEAASALRMGRRPVTLRRADLVIHSGGHMRAFSGHAYLPAQFPAGVTAEDIR